MGGRGGGGGGDGLDINKGWKVVLVVRSTGQLLALYSDGP
jgi:hypothetical protein